MKPILVGEESLGKKLREDGNPTSDYFFEPLVTEPIADGQRYVLLPHRKFVVVLSYATGKRLGILVLDIAPENGGANGSQRNQSDIFLECATLEVVPIPCKQESLSQLLKKSKNDSGNLQSLSTRPGFQEILFVGCSNGCILEYPIVDLTKLTPSSTGIADLGSFCDVGEHFIPGPLCYAQRIIRIPGEGASRPIKFLSFPKSEEKKKHGNALLCFALITTSIDRRQTKKKVITSSELSLLRIHLAINEGNGSVGQSFVNYNEHEQADVQSLAVIRQMNLTPKTAMRKRPIQTESSQVINFLSFRSSSGVLLVLACHHGINLFHDDLDDGLCPSIFCRTSSKGPLTAFASASNSCDIACGHQTGKIFVLKDFLPVHHEYLLKLRRFQHAQKNKNNGLLVSKPVEPTVIQRRMHWHAHAVASLCFESHAVAEEPYLYSGGIESVLCGWQLARGIDKPSLTLPRLGLTGISQICHIGSDVGHPGVLVHFSDGSLQLFNAHNLKLKWQITSPPQSKCSNRTDSSHQIRSVRLPTSMETGKVAVAVFGSPDGGGILHWYDPRSNSINRSSEIAPFNRVSRTDAKDVDLPTPLISHGVWNESGMVMMTVDIVSTELFTFGIHNSLPNKVSFGSVTTLKFWSAENNHDVQEQYQVVAQLVSPHGKNSAICAASLSSSGNLACTVSGEEMSFRIWENRGNERKRSEAQWFCKYRVEIPCGFANQYNEAGAIAFSYDDSSLAIGFGNHVTIWDVEEQALLTVLPHKTDDLGAIVQSILFLPPASRFQEMILTSSERHITLQTPFGHNGPENVGWSWSLQPDNIDTVISCASYIASAEVVAIALYDQMQKTGRILFVDLETGNPSNHADIMAVSGRVSQITSLLAPETVGCRWDDSTPSSKQNFIDIMFLVNGGRTFRWLSGEPRESSNRHRVERIPTIVSRPFQSLHEHMGDLRKRPREALSFLDLSSISEKKLCLDRFGTVRVGSVVDEEVPLLRTGFSKAFLSRHLKRKGRKS